MTNESKRHDLSASFFCPLGTRGALTIRISYVRHDAELLRARALRHNRISKTRCAPLCRPLRLTSALFTPGRPGNSISTNYHSFRKKDKCKREPNQCGRRCALPYRQVPGRDVTRGKYLILSGRSSFSFYGFVASRHLSSSCPVRFSHLPLPTIRDFITISHGRFHIFLSPCSFHSQTGEI